MSSYPDVSTEYRPGAGGRVGTHHDIRLAKAGVCRGDWRLVPRRKAGEASKRNRYPSLVKAFKVYEEVRSLLGHQIIAVDVPDTDDTDALIDRYIARLRLARAEAYEEGEVGWERPKIPVDLRTHCPEGFRASSDHLVGHVTCTKNSLWAIRALKDGGGELQWWRAKTAPPAGCKEQHEELLSTAGLLAEPGAKECRAADAITKFMQTV